MEFPRRKKVDANIDMTPMIDTLLQLFVVFMLNMTFLTSAIRLSLPQASADQPGPTDIVVVTLNAAGQLFINNQPAERSELPNRLVPLVQKSKERRVMLRADRTLAYEKVLETLVAIQQAGISQVN